MIQIRDYGPFQRFPPFGVNRACKKVSAIFRCRLILFNGYRIVLLSIRNIPDGPQVLLLGVGCEEKQVGRMWARFKKGPEGLCGLHATSFR
jgi:hypothetical protein